MAEAYIIDAVRTPRGKGKRRADKPVGGQKRSLKFKNDKENGAAN